jgi:hypothetical protein
MVPLLFYRIATTDPPTVLDFISNQALDKPLRRNRSYTDSGTVRMHYEVWALDTRNLIATPPTEAEALALVHELLTAGWDPCDLEIGAVRDDGEHEDVQALPTLTGAELAARARDINGNRTPRSA